MIRRLQPALLSSVKLDHLLAAMFRIADQPLAARINDPVHRLKGNLADQRPN
ncbi:MAG: hypothetical protein L0Y71_19645 [Gemmataceae bacterium]|nr:hypothetical protein [Gemmataceae bacterium]